MLYLGVVRIEKIIILINKSSKSRYQIAKESGIPASTLSRIVNRKQKSIDLKTAFKLADALGVSLADFREEKNTTNE